MPNSRATRKHPPSTCSRLRGLHGGTLWPVVRAIPAVAVMEDLMLARPALELNHENRLYLGPVTSGRPCVDGFDNHVLGKKVELVHASLRDERGVLL